MNTCSPLNIHPSINHNLVAYIQLLLMDSGVFVLDGWWFSLSMEFIVRFSLLVTGLRANDQMFSFKCCRSKEKVESVADEKLNV